MGSSRSKLAESRAAALLAALTASIRADLIAVGLCWLTAYVLRLAIGHAFGTVTSPDNFSDYLVVLPLIVSIWTLAFRIVGLAPEAVWSNSRIPWIAAVKGWFLSGLVIFIALRGVFADRNYSRAVIVGFLMLSLGQIVLVRRFLPSQAMRKCAERPFREVGRSARAFASELVAVGMAWLGAYVVRFYVVGTGVATGAAPPITDYVVVLPVILAAWLAALVAFVKPTGSGPGSSQSLGIAKAVIVAGGVVYLIVRTVFAHLHLSRSVIAYSIGFAIVGLVIARTPVQRLSQLLLPRTTPAPRLEIAVAAFGAAALLVHYLYVGIQSGFLPCSLDCGETYESYIGARNLQRFGLRYAGGLQDFAVGDRIESHPALYTHNPNIAMYFMYGLLRVGVHNIHAHAAFASVPFSIGLLYMYLFVRTISGSGTAAALSLANAAISYPLVIHWAFQPLRGFSWLLLFGAAYHLFRYSMTARWSWRHLVPAIVFMALSFAVDYPFALFVFLTIIGLRIVGVVRIPYRRIAVILVVAYGVPFVLRQIQVGVVVGFSFWALDVWYSLLTRFGPARLLLWPPDDAILQALYATRNIIKWPNPSTLYPAALVQKILLAQSAVLGAPVTVFMVVAIAVLLGAYLRGTTTEPVKEEGSLLRLGQIVLVLLVAQIGTFCVFPAYVAVFYGFVLAPLLVHWVVPLLALATVVLLANLRERVRVSGVKVPVAALLLLLLCVSRVESEWRNHRDLPPAGYPGREVIQEMKGQSFATFWISSPVSAYTEEWAAVLATPRVLDARKLPFDPAHDYYYFFQADKNNPEYRRPAFLFVPGVNVGWLHNPRCRPLQGRVGTYVVSCTDFEAIARRLNWLSRHGGGAGYLIYDLRELYIRSDRHRAAFKANGVPGSDE